VIDEPGRDNARARRDEAASPSVLSSARDCASPPAALYAGRLSPADKVVIGYLIIIVALVAISRQRVDLWLAIIALHAIAIAAVALIARLSRRVASPRGALALIRGWYPILLVPLTFKELTYLIPLLHPRDFDWELAAIDYRMFGAHPTVWLERVTWPLATEMLQLAYITYYFLPIALAVVLWCHGWFERFHFFVFIGVLGFYLSYLGYIAVPAIGPRFILADQQTRPLTGLLLFEHIQAALNRLEGVTRDCFPSGHTELTLLVLYYAQRFHRRTFWWILPAGVALVISTVYLRYHYVIDVIAGALLALAVVIAAKPLYRALGGGAHHA
jgi:membrane-associated phospholipid phosphatase